MSNRFFIDAEFIEDGLTIEPISIAVVRGDGICDSYYAISNNYHTINRARNDTWLNNNVLPSLPIRLDNSGWHWDSLHEDFDNVIDFQSQMFRDELLSFFDPHDSDGPVELWADCGAYDHVMLMQLFGPMVKKPDTLPYYTHDWQQELERLDPDFKLRLHLPIQGSGLHNALADARHLRDSFKTLQMLAAQGKINSALATLDRINPGQ